LEFESGPVRHTRDSVSYKVFQRTPQSTVTLLSRTILRSLNPRNISDRTLPGPMILSPWSLVRLSCQSVYGILRHRRGHFHCLGPPEAVRAEIGGSCQGTGTNVPSLFWIRRRKSLLVNFTKHLSDRPDASDSKKTLSFCQILLSCHHRAVFHSCFLLRGDISRRKGFLSSVFRLESDSTNTLKYDFLVVVDVVCN